MFIVISLDKYIAPPIPASTTCNDVVCESECAGSEVVVDHSGMRILFINNEKVVSVKEIKEWKNPLSLYGTCIADEDCFYVCKYTYKESSSEINSEQIIKFDKFGNKIGIIFNIVYSQDEWHPFNPSLLNLAVDSDNLYILKNNISDNSLNVWSADKSLMDETLVEQNNTSDIPDYINKEFRNIDSVPNNETIYTATYDPQTDTVSVITNLANIYSYTNNSDEQTSKKLNNPVQMTEIPTNFKNNYVTNNYVWDNDGKDVSYSFIVELRLILFWFGVFILSIVILAGIIYGIRLCFKRNKTRPIRFGATILLSIIVSSSVVLYYSNAITKISLEHLSTSLTSLSSVLTSSQKEMFTNCALDFINSGDVSPDNYKNALSILSEASAQARLNGKEIEFCLTAEKDGKVYLLLDSYDSSILGTYMNPSIQFQDTYQSEISQIRAHNGEYIYAKTPIVTNGEVVGSLDAVCHYTVFTSMLFHRCLELFLALIAVFISLSFIVLELKSFISVHKKYKVLIKKKVEDAEVVLARPLTFFSVFQMSCDSALITLIAKDLLTNNNVANYSLMASFPIAAISVGYFLGVVLHAWVFRKFPTKPALLSTTALSIISFAMCFYAITINNFYLLLIGLVLANTFSEFTMLFSELLLVLVKDDDMRTSINRELSASRISGASIAVLVSGFLSQTFGNSFVYVAAIIGSAVFIVYIFVAIPNNADYKKIFKGESKTGGFVSSMKACFSHKSFFVVMVIVAAIPALISGYKSYLFPLYAADHNLNKALISNILVFVNALTFYSVPLVSKIEQKISSRGMITITCVLIGSMFLLLNVNLSITLSIVVLFVATMSNKMLTPSIINYLFSIADKYHFENKTKVIANQFSFILSTIYNCVKAPLLGGLSSLGYALGIGFIGLYSFFSGGFFWTTSKQDCLTKQDDKPTAKDK